MLTHLPFCTMSCPFAKASSDSSVFEDGNTAVTHLSLVITVNTFV